MQWTLIEKGGVLIIEALNIWPIIIEIEELLGKKGELNLETI